MKLYLLLAIVGFAAASRPLSGGLKWQPDTEYIYKYSGRLLTGLPELAERHFSGMAIQCQVHLTAHDENLVTLRVVNPKYARVNDVLEQSSADQEGRNWRYLNLPGYQPVPDQTRRMLANPTVFRLAPDSGRVESLTMSAEELEWSQNFKKALIVLFQTQNAPEDAIRSNSIDDITNNDEETNGPNFWSTYEESLDGVCRVRYEVFEMPKATIFEEEEFAANHFCSQDAKVYQMIKTKDVNNCLHRKSFVYAKPGTFDCHYGLNRTGNCAGMYSRSSVTRYVLCGGVNGDSELVIRSIVNEGELQQDLMGFRSEKMLTGTRQVLTLTSKHSGSTGGVSRPTSPIEMDNLFHEYGSKTEEMKVSSSLKKIPGLSARPQGGSHKEEVMEEMRQTIKQIVEHDLFTHEGLPETQITLKALGLAKGFRALETQDMEKLYNELKAQYRSEEKINVFKNIFLDTSIMSGTPESVKFVKKMILEGQATVTQAESILLSWSRNIVTPNARVLEEIYDLVTSSKVRQISQENGGNNVYNSAVLGYSVLIEKACLAYNRNVSYPTWIYGEFCNKHSYIVEGRWIPYLEEKIRSRSDNAEETQVHVVALALLGHKNVLPTLNHVLNNPEQYTPITRTLAVYAHVGVGRHYPRRVLSTLSAVYFNQAERTEVRAAAFNVIIKLSPEQYLLQKIAARTWNETDYEILKLVNTAFYSLTEATSLEDMKPDSSQLVRKVRLIYPLIKKTGGKFPTTGTIYINDYLKRLDVGYERNNLWITPKDATAPTFFYNKINYLMDEYRFTPIEYGYNIRGANSIIKDILKELTGKKTGTEDEIGSKMSGEWRRVVEKLKIKERKETGRPEGNLYLNVFETTPIFYNFVEESSQSLREKVRDMMENPDKLIKKFISGDSSSDQVSFQRLFNLAPSFYSIPSDMGLPINIEVNMPVVLSAQGKLQPQLTGSQFSINSKVQVMAAVQYIGWVGTIDPFAQDYVVTGIDEHVALNIPAEIQVALNGPQQSLQVDIKALEHIKRNGQSVDVYHYHVRPYTVHQKIWKIKPMTLSPNMKIIHSTRGDVIKTLREPVLQPFGLGLELMVKTQSNMDSIAQGFFEKLRLYNYNPINMLRFTFVSTAYSPDHRPSLRLHIIKLKYNPSEATTREVLTQVKFGVATKETGKSAKYHSIKSGYRSLEIESKLLGSGSRHQERMEKIREALEKTGVRSGYGINFDLTTQFKGNSQSNIHWSMTAGFGSDAEIKTKYNIQLESNKQEKLCLHGEIDQPLSSARYNIHKIRSEAGSYRFESVLGFGNSCQDKEIRVEGTSHTSEHQKEISKTSREAKEYQKLVNTGAPLAHLSQAAEKVRRQASTLDEVDYTINYKNLPEYYIVAGEHFIEFLKVYLYPNMRYNPIPNRRSSGSSGSGKIEYAIRFHPNNGTFALKIDRSGNSEPNIYFDDIRMPFPFAYYFPVSTVEPTLPLTKSLSGGSGLGPVCKVEGKHVRTFDNKEVRLREDGCFYLLAADGGDNGFDWAVLLKSGPDSDKPRTLRIKAGNAKVDLTFERNGQIETRINEQSVDISRGKSVPIIDRGLEVGQLRRASDDTLSLQSKWLNLDFKASLLEIFPSVFYKNEVTGLCGNMNNDKKDDLLTPGMCLVSKVEVFAASWRLPSSGSRCLPLSGEIRHKLRKETEERCIRPSSSGSAVSRSYDDGYGGSYDESYGESYGESYDYTDSGKVYAHLVIDESYRGKVCLSKFPQSECRKGSQATDYKKKDVDFHCMDKKSETAKDFVRRARAGETIPELANTTTSYTRKIALPTGCFKE